MSSAQGGNTVTTTARNAAGEATSITEVSIAQVDVGSIVLLDEVRIHNPEIVAILSVFGQGGLPLPAGLSYDQATGRLSLRGWVNWDPEQSPIYAQAVDRMEKLLLLRVCKVQKILVAR